jgi:hypothetical protein
VKISFEKLDLLYGATRAVQAVPSNGPSRTNASQSRGLGRALSKISQINALLRSLAVCKDPARYHARPTRLHEELESKLSRVRGDYRRTAFHDVSSGLMRGAFLRKVIPP